MEGREKEPLYSISVAARLIGVSPRVLRSYEEAELITPHRTSGKTRFYSTIDIKKLQLISYLHKKESVNISGIKIILEIMSGERSISQLTQEAEDAQNILEDNLYNEDNE